MTRGIYLLLGSNKGDKRLVLEEAVKLINNKIGKVLTKSSFYSTNAWGKEDQPDFINQVLEITSSLTASQLLEHLHSIELQLGRIRKEKWGPRIIDIDILYFNNQVIDFEYLKVPHPGIPNRRFTLVPLCEISPDFIHPTLKKSNMELLNSCNDDLAVTRL